jgi:hypothetical protein
VFQVDSEEGNLPFAFERQFDHIHVVDRDSESSRIKSTAECFWHPSDDGKLDTPW